MATPKHVITEENQHAVQVLSAAGTPRRTIAKALKFSQETLKKYYAEDLEEGLELANARVVQRLFLLIMQGSTPAAIFWLKSRAGWKESQKIEVESKEPIYDFKHLRKEERDQLRSLLEKGMSVPEEFATKH